jgi:hypothetical protein
MIAESLDNAFADMSERLWTEMVLKSNELIPAVRSALTLVGDQLGPDEVQRIAKLVADVEEALEAHSPPRLKKANAELDEGTQHLATLLIDRAMAEAAKRSAS